MGISSEEYLSAVKQAYETGQIDLAEIILTHVKDLTDEQRNIIWSLVKDLIDN